MSRRIDSLLRDDLTAAHAIYLSSAVSVLLAAPSPKLLCGYRRRVGLLEPSPGREEVQVGVKGGG